MKARGMSAPGASCMRGVKGDCYVLYLLCVAVLRASGSGFRQAIVLPSLVLPMQGSTQLGRLQNGRA